MIARPEHLRALGHYLTRQGITNAFIAIGVDDIIVTPVAGLVVTSSIVYTPDDLLKIWHEFAASHGPGPDLLEEAGRRLIAHHCHRAFLVLYDGRVIVDGDAHGDWHHFVFDTNLAHETPAS